MRALLLTGSGRYSDPWHPFKETSRRLTEILHCDGVEVVEASDVDEGLASLSDDTTIDLVVVNAGDPWRTDLPDCPRRAERDEGFCSAVNRGIGVLAFHAAAASLRDVPDWAGALGGVWIPGLSTHPPLDSTAISLVDYIHPILEGVRDFSVMDERYCRLQRTGRSEVLATHPGMGGPEPAVWARTFGRSRIVYDALGHDARSFDSTGHARLIANAARWAARPEPSSPGRVA